MSIAGISHERFLLKLIEDVFSIFRSCYLPIAYIVAKNVERMKLNFIDVIQSVE